MSAPDNIGGDKSVAAKITHVKTATIDGIKVAPVNVQGAAAGSGGQQTQQAQQHTTTAFRTIASSGQPTQVRVVMPQGTLMPQSMLKQIEGAGRTQITAIPARTVSNTSITVTRPLTPSAYLPRAGVTSSMPGQRLVTPIRAQTTPVTGLAANFVRGTTVTRNTSSPATTVISPTTAWMANNGGQVQLIRAINQPRQRLISQNITATGVSGGGGSGGVVTVTSQSSQGNQQVGNQSNLQTVSSQQAQQTFVATLATVHPRQQTTALVYTNVSNSQTQQYNPAVNATQRFAVGPLASTQRQIRPISMTKSFSTAKLGVGINTTSISIRAPNLPLLNTALSSASAPGGGSAVSSGGVGSGLSTAGTIQARGTAGNTNIPTTRIIQLQQQPGGATQQIIGTAGRIANNVLLQPILVNTSGGGKIGVRPSTTMAAKVQPSLTITQLGIGKLPPNAQQQTSTSASIQCASVSTASAAGNTNVVTSAAVAPIISQQSHVQQQTVTVNSQSPIAQIVNVSQNLGGGTTGQLLPTQNVSTATTVVPLAISTRGSNVLTGTITPIKNASLTVGKMMTSQSSIVNQHQSQTGSQSSQVTEIMTGAQQHHPQQQPTSVFIHHTRPHSGGSASGVGPTSGGSAATVIPSTGTSFLPPGSAFYYESVPASSVTVSTGVLSLTTTTVTSSTMSNSQIVTSSNLAAGIVTSLPFNTPSSATFTVVPSANRTIGQLQIPATSTSTQIQAVPVRFSAQMSSDHTINPSAVQQGQTNQQTHHQIIIPSQAAAAVAAQQSQSQQQQSQGHMVIPLPTSIKVTSGNNTVSTLSTSTFLRKRDNDGSPIRAAKNLGPTLLSMSSASSNSTVSSQQTTSSVSSIAGNKKEQRAVSPASSDGSTTVSANSSPGVDQQINEELTPVNRIPNESHFNPINDLYPNHQNSSVANARDNIGQQSNQSHLNGAIDCPPRKKSRRSTNDSQQSTQSHASSLPSLNPPASNSSQTSNANGTVNSNSGLVVTTTISAALAEPPKVNNNNQSININSNKENTKPTEFVIKKPRTCTLLNSYKQNWKAANNHFQRHSDVKPREERRPTVMDLANQANVLGKINGWKIHHLKSQMEDLCESESKGYEKLTLMLKQMESHGKNTDIERISDLIKGNMQRSKIIVDGITEAQNQIMKIFDHKSHISDIIHRCASKRNFKKREKA